MNSRYWRNVASVLSGTAIAQALPILASLVLTRLFAPQDFGLYSAWLGIVSIIGIVITGRFEMALVLEPDGESRSQAMFATVLTMLAATGLFILILLIALPWLPLPDHPQASNLAWLLAPTALTTACVQCWLSWAAANGDYRTLSVIRITQSASIVGLQLLVGLWAAHASSLALAHLAGLLMTLIVAAIRLPLSWPAVSTGQAMRTLWTRHRRFPLLSLPADTLNVASAQLPLLIVASRFGAEIAGYLALTMRTLGVSSSLLGNAVLDVFKRDASSSFRSTGNCTSDFMRTFKVLAPAAAVGALLLALFVEPLFTFAFGNVWHSAGHIALWLLPLFALRLVASPLSYTVYIAGKQHLDLIWQIGLMATTLACLYLPGSWSTAIQLYSLGYSMMYVIYLLMSYQFSRGDAREAA